MRNPIFVLLRGVRFIHRIGTFLYRSLLVSVLQGESGSLGLIEAILLASRFWQFREIEFHDT